MDAQAAGRPEYRHRDRERMARHRRYRRETPVVDLLPAARAVQLHHLDPQGVVKVRNGRVIEGDVPVFAYSKANEVDRPLGEQLGIAGANGGAVRFLRRQGVEGPDFHAGQKMLAQVAPEALRVVAAKAGVFVHVEHRDAAPIDGVRAAVGERRQEFILGRGARKNDAGVSLRGDDAPQVDGHRGGGDAAHVGASREDLYRQPIDGEGSGIWKFHRKGDSVTPNAAAGASDQRRRASGMSRPRKLAVLCTPSSGASVEPANPSPPGLRAMPSEPMDTASSPMV